jgi:putative FmdB family regulatory protein
MPTYTYRCTKCGNESEVVQSMSDPPLKRCRKCRGALRRTFHPVGIVLKGAGFHRNDYRTKPVPSESSDGKASSDKKESSDRKESSDKKTQSETKTESKPAAKSSDD